MPRHRLAPLLVVSLVIAGCATPAPLAESAVPGRPVPAVPAVLTPARIEPQAPLDDHVPGVRNFGFVSADVWRGAMPTPDGLRLLAAMGCRTIIDLQDVDEASTVPVGVGYVPLRCSSLHCDRVDTAAVLQAIAASPKPVFIHCREGRDRTGLAVAAYRLSEGMTADAALDEMRNFHLNFWWQGAMADRVRALAAK